MADQPERVPFDPGKARLDLSLQEAFDLTSVRSANDYRRLSERLAEIRGTSYFFVNISDNRARLMATVIVAEGCEVTTSYVLDHHALGMDDDMLLFASRESGNYPLSLQMQQKIHLALSDREWRFFKID
ncbi:MAG: hypothetical protein HPY61_07665 [Methanotrichaceae archaeon]|nr:hypothetical protein [Methanotrichaceae archaeon]